jgi:methyl-accepting chemotaxis protein
MCIRYIISDVYYEEGKPLMTIARASAQASRGTDIFILDLSFIINTLTEIKTEGSFLELVDNLGQVIYSDKSSDNVTKLDKLITVADQEWRLNGYIDNQYVKGHTSSLSNSINFVSLGFGSLIMLGGVIIIFITYRPIVALRELVEDLAHGDADLTKRLKANNNDDISRISKGINKFVQHLQNMMLEVKDSSEQSTKEIDSLQDKTTANREMIKSHNQEIDLAVTAITEMSTTASTVAESAQHAATQTSAALAAMGSSKVIVEEAVRSVDSLTLEFDNMAKSINSMVSDVEQIAKVLDVISGIQEQTNLLALNAAIEAARAGEQGRGFAVVADEVRALAGRTQQSTSEINDMLGKLQNGSAKVVKALDGTLVSCHNTSSNTNKIHESLDIVGNSVTNIADLNEQISHSAIEQREVSVEIDKNMIAMRDMVLMLGENGESASEKMKELTATNKSLGKLVGQFKLQ